MDQKLGNFLIWEKHACHTFLMHCSFRVDSEALKISETLSLWSSSHHLRCMSYIAIQLFAVVSSSNLFRLPFLIHPFMYYSLRIRRRSECEANIHPASVLTWFFSASGDVGQKTSLERGIFKGSSNEIRNAEFRWIKGRKRTFVGFKTISDWILCSISAIPIIHCFLSHEKPSRNLCEMCSEPIRTN